MALDGTKGACQMPPKQQAGHEPRANAQGRKAAQARDQMALSARPRSLWRPGRPAPTAREAGQWSSPDELRQQGRRLEKILQARKKMEAETAANRSASSCMRRPRAKAACLSGSGCSGSGGRAELNRKAEGQQQGQGCPGGCDRGAENAGVEPTRSGATAADAEPQAGACRRKLMAPQPRGERNFTDPESHLIAVERFLSAGLQLPAGRWTAITR